MVEVWGNGIREGRLARFAAVLLASVLAMSALAGLAGCSGGSSGGKSASGETAAQETPDFVGAWDMISVTFNGETLDEKDIAKSRDDGSDFFININDDATWLLCFGDEDHTAEGTWAQSSDGNLTLTDESGSVSAFAIDGDTAKLSAMSFKKAGPEPKTPPAAPEASSSKASSSASSAEAEDTASSSAAEAEEPASSDTAESGEVSADLKEALDSYEAFIDEYVAFMQEYKDSGNAVAMLSDYTSFLQRYTDFAQKIDAMDTSGMSKADYAYYIEVTARVSQKLLGVL